MKHAFFLLFPVLSTIAAAQSATTITAPVSRTVTLAAEEAAFTIAIAATSESTLQQVKQALQNAGLPNPTVVTTGLGLARESAWFEVPPEILYSATLTIPAGSATDAGKRLETLRAQMPPPLVRLQYAAALAASQKTLDATRQELMPQLMEEARKLAQALAAAAGVKLGSIRSVSDSGGAVGIVYAYANRLGSIYDPLTGAPPNFGSGLRYTFSVNVVFATTP